MMRCVFIRIFISVINMGGGTQGGEVGCEGFDFGGRCTQIWLQAAASYGGPPFTSYMLIRSLTASDAASYQELRLRALQECPTAFSASYADELRRSPSEVVTRVTAAADGSFCVFGAYLEEQLVGILAFVRPVREKLRHSAELAGMYVASEARRRGLGGALIDAAITHARSLDGIRQLRLTVNAVNAEARSLYQRKGFRCFGVEPDAICVDGRYYDEALYQLPLDGIEPQ